MAFLSSWCLVLWATKGYLFCSLGTCRILLNSTAATAPQKWP